MTRFDTQVGNILKSIESNDHNSAIEQIQNAMDNGFFVANLILYKGVIGKYLDKDDSLEELTQLMHVFRKVQKKPEDNRISKHPLIIEALYGMFENERYKDILSLSNLVSYFDDNIATIIGKRPLKNVNEFTNKRLINFSKSDFNHDQFYPRMLFAARRFWDGPNSRLHDCGPRFQEAFSRQGWAMELVDFETPTSEYDEKIIQSVGNQKQLDFDILLIDAQSSYFENCVIRNFCNSVRYANQKIIIIGVFNDSWMPNVAKKIKEYDESFDYIWEITGRRTFIEKFDAKKIINLPIPIGIKREIDNSNNNSDNKIRFSGGVNIANFSRLIWLSHIKVNHPGIDIDISRHKREDVGVLDSYRRYMQRISSSQIGLNFTTRTNGMQIVPGRTYEILANRVPLVQEYSEDMHSLFEPGKHYLEFSNVDEFDELSQKYLMMRTCSERFVRTAIKNLKKIFRTTQFYPMYTTE